MKTRQILYADDSMVLTDGETYGTVIYLAEGEDASKYREITKEEYEKLLQENEENLIP